MELLWNGLLEAARLIATGDPDVLQITWLSVQISGSATLLSLLVGIPVGMALALARFPGRSLCVALVNTGMGLPPVVVGLFVSLFLWRSGPLGFLGFLYTPTAMVVAQFIIAAPIVTGLTSAAMQQLNPRLRLQLLALGASRWQLLWLLMREARLPLLAAVMAGFGGVISEVGASMMVGGNLQGQTRVLTTATVLETSKGNFDLAIALSVILLLLAFSVNYLLTWIQQRGRTP
ncbi:MAG: ABC transporter permease [candidate division NC10 bacterium]|nr:ABC transporter permease [candidate division NC10 bacterium]MBI2162884.1 ABC transporter permease [candidate division NC10 bacterium]MBI3085828.1 ABC transporter permease [candidate division NC10 bacterium]MBI3121486.1 ABC transporter permease [candidate division NC10 bacterium]